MASGLGPGLTFPEQCLRDTRTLLWGPVDLWPHHVSERPWEPCRGFARRHRAPHTVGKFKISPEQQHQAMLGSRLWLQKGLPISEDPPHSLSHQEPACWRLWLLQWVLPSLWCGVLVVVIPRIHGMG